MIKKIVEIKNNFFVFQEDFLETNAGLILTSGGAIVIDTLYRPNDARKITDFLEKKGIRPVLIILTHGHTTHIYGWEVFPPQCHVIAHKLCKEYIRQNFKDDWKEWEKKDPSLKKIKQVKPLITFNGEIKSAVDDLDLVFLETPGHSKDSISIFFPKEKILFTGDAVLTPNDVPFFEEDYSLTTIKSLKKLINLNPKYVVPGHGKITDKTGILDNIFYISQIRKIVKKNLSKSKENFGKEIPLEKCIRKKFNPIWPELHEWNVNKVYNEFARNPW